VEFPLARRPASPAVLALAIGALVGPPGLRLLEPQLMEDGGLIQSVSEVALLVCLFCVGLRLRVPFDWRPWRVPLHLSTLTMLATVIFGALAAHVLFEMSFVQALLLGAILAPTDPALVSDVHAPPEGEQDTTPFTLAAEGAINNGLALPLVLLVLGLMGLDDKDSAALGSLASAALWAVVGALFAGWLIGAGMARWITLLDADRQADFLEEMMVFATAALAYGCAVAIRTDGFLAVFAAGLALCHGGRVRPPMRNRALAPHVLRIAGRVERFAALTIIMLLGAMITGVDLRFKVLVFALVLLVVVRPFAVRLGLGRLAIPPAQRRSVAWFGVRGTASLYCLAFAINHGLSAPFARQLTGITLLVIVTSIVARGVSEMPLRRPSPGAVDL
jgi:NhaP-type Na+/H+ or K+/H+ antiporter